MWLPTRQRITTFYLRSTCSTSPILHKHVDCPGRRQSFARTPPAVFVLPVEIGRAFAPPSRQTRMFNGVAQNINVAAPGLRIKMHLKGTFDDGETFDDTFDDQPLTAVLGKGCLVPALDSGIVGMSVGEEREFRVDNAFGEVDDSTRFVTTPNDQIPADCAVGSELRTADGRVCKVVERTNDSSKLEFFHPFAGKTVNYFVKLVSCTKVNPITKLGWETLSQGDSKTFPQPGNTVTVHYTGMLASTGFVFDSSRTRGDPFTFKIGVGRVIQGWDDGLLEMSLGERCELSIPYNMAYGVRGSGPKIPPSADLIFDIELLSIN